MRGIWEGMEVSMRPRDSAGLAALILERRPSQASLARSVGKSAPYLNLLVRGQRTCSLPTAQAIVRELGGPPLTVDGLFELIVRDSAKTANAVPQSGGTVAAAA